VGGATNPSLPTNVLADKVVANKTSQTIHYEGHVRAWNGSDVIQSPALDVYRAQRRVSTSARVVTSFMQSFQGTAGPEGSAHPAAEPRPVTVQSDALEYFDEGRRARYLGHVRMVSDSMIMQSDKLDVYLTATGATSGSQVDHAIADGKVKVTEPERVGTGNHGEYFAAAGKIILTGGPPVLVDEKKGNTTGQRLTFFIHDDRLLVDGGAQSPSVTQHRVAP
jgi:lipopolysaccharide transport protein LptA